MKMERIQKLSIRKIHKSVAELKQRKIEKKRFFH
jgi:hypothetical protein